jgi:alkanesulfonate monooxygenase SsuD/methylene tetrahydromethanopterin reductase-like flavin-dependent oxidoreductase (luciferase family)
VPESLRTLIADIPSTRDRAVTVPLTRHIPDEWVGAFIIAGDVEHVAEQVVGVLRRDVDHFMIRPVAIDGDQVGALRRFAEDVLPIVRRELGED